MHLISVSSPLPPFCHFSFLIRSSTKQNVPWHLGSLSHVLPQHILITQSMPLPTPWHTWCNQGPPVGVILRGKKDLLWSSEKQIISLSGFQTMNVLDSICSFSDNMLCGKCSAPWRFWVNERSLSLSPASLHHLFISLVTNPGDSQNCKAENVTK